MVRSCIKSTLKWIFALRVSKEEYASRSKIISLAELMGERRKRKNINTKYFITIKEKCDLNVFPLPFLLYSFFLFKIQCQRINTIPQSSTFFRSIIKDVS